MARTKSRVAGGPICKGGGDQREWDVLGDRKVFDQFNKLSIILRSLLIDQNGHLTIHPFWSILDQSKFLLVCFNHWLIYGLIIGHNLIDYLSKESAAAGRECHGHCNCRRGMHGRVELALRWIWRWLSDDLLPTVKWGWSKLDSNVISF